MASTRGTGSSLPLWQRASPTAGGTWMRWTWLSLAGRPERSAALMASMQRRHESVSEPHVANHSVAGSVLMARGNERYLLADLTELENP